MCRVMPIAVAGLLTLRAAAAGPDLARTIVKDGGALEYARQLTALGPRLTGSPGYARAAEWAAGRFRAAGIDRVVLDPFTVPDGWQRERAAARIVSPVAQRLHVAALGWTPSTPDGGVAAEVAALDDAVSPDAIAAQAGRVAGRIVLLPTNDGGGGAAEAIAGRRRALDAALRDAGAVAVLSADDGPGNVLGARDRSVGARVSVLPGAQVGRDDARTIRRLLDRGPVRIAIDLQNRVTRGPIPMHNVVAEIRGRETPDEWVVVGAHLDSWDFAAGAQDNASGVAMVLEAARAIAALHAPPRRSIRFALWGAEEQGQLGSTAYVRAHEPELDLCVAALNSDAGTGRLIGWTAPDRADVSRATRALVQPLLAAIGGVTFDQSLRYAFQSDGAAFVRGGVPVLDLNADDTRYEDIHHKVTDTMARVDPRNLAAGAATVAVTALAVADAPTRIAPRVDRRSGGQR